MLSYIIWCQKSDIGALNMTIRKKRAITMVLILGIAITMFSCALMTMSFRKMQADTYVHTSLLNTTSAISRLNYALSFGKPLNKYYGLDELLEETMSLSEDILGIEVIDKEGTQITTCGQTLESVRQSGAGEQYILKKDSIYTFVPFDAGMLVMRLNISGVLESTRNYISFITRVALCVLAGIFAMTLLCFLLYSGDSISVKRMRYTGIIILLLAQGVMSGISMHYMDVSYRESVEKVALATSRMVETDINAVIDKGVSYSEITGLDRYLSHLVADIPELSNLVIGERTSGSLNNTSEFKLSIKGEDEGRISLLCHYNQNQINNIRRNNIIDSLILILIIVFISLEAINFLTKHLEMKDQRKDGELYLPGFRLFVFVEGIAFSLDLGFFSVLSSKMFSAMNLPDSMSFLSGMPNTMFSAAVLIGLFEASSLIRRFGMKRMLTFGIIMGIVGYIFCAIAINLPMLILARFIFGFCDGIIINSIRLYASSQADPEIHTRILVEYMAAINLGVSCGVVIGGLLADAASYTTVFLAGAALGAVCLLLIWFAGFPRRQEAKEEMSFLIAIKELGKPQILIFMVCVVLPLYIATLFVGYTFPLFGDEAGFSNSMVSGCLMINFIIIAYLTDPISEWAMKKFSPKILVPVYMVLQTISIGIFVVTSSVWAAILALVLTSLWDCFGMVAMDLGLDHIEGTNTEKCTLLQMLFGKLGMVIGPVAITTQLGRGSAGATGVIVVIMIIGFILYMISTIVFSKGRSKESDQPCKGGHK